MLVNGTVSKLIHNLANLLILKISYSDLAFAQALKQIYREWESATVLEAYRDHY